MATIEGNVVLDGGLQQGVSVGAYSADGTALLDTDTTDAQGAYALTAGLPCWVGPIYDDGSQLYSAPFEYVPMPTMGGNQPPSVASPIGNITLTQIAGNQAPVVADAIADITLTQTV